VNVVHVVWVIENACPDCQQVLIEIGLDDGIVVQGCAACGRSARWRIEAEASADPAGNRSVPGGIRRCAV
jgi:uncharacterized Zn finger protein (UPF0148 family)